MVRSDTTLCSNMVWSVLPLCTIMVQSDMKQMGIHRNLLSHTRNWELFKFYFPILKILEKWLKIISPQLRIPWFFFAFLTENYCENENAIEFSMGNPYFRPTPVFLLLLLLYSPSPDCRYSNCWLLPLGCVSTLWFTVLTRTGLGVGAILLRQADSTRSRFQHLMTL